MIRAVIFDFDSLIVDTETPDYQSWAETFVAHGRRLEFSTWAPFIGRSGGTFDLYPAPCETAWPAIRPGSRPAERYLELLEAQPLLPGVTEHIADAGRLGLRVGVASSSTREWVAGHLARLGLAESIEHIGSSDDVEQTKPDPAVYAVTLAALGVKGQETIALEDSPNGVPCGEACRGVLRGRAQPDDTGPVVRPG